MNKLWNVKKYENDLVDKYVKELNISKILAKMIISNNIELDKAKDFLECDINKLESPFNIKDMDKFVKIVKQYIEDNKKICIYGDYDADGITSICILYSFLKELNADVIYYLPNRLLDGYGVSKEAIDKLKEQDVELIITVDCGITALEEVKYANKLGMKVCITDHHECLDKLPKAEVVINAKRKDNNKCYKDYAGVGVTFKCLEALSSEYNKKGYFKYLDIVALGTVADIVPLTLQNRILAKNGILKINETENLGLKAIKEINNLNKIDAETISFNIAPKINACGRMGNPELAVDLLLCKDYNNAKVLAEKLNEQNRLRQKVEFKTYEECIKNIDDKKYSICKYGENFHSGVIGIVASKLTNEYNKPVILFTKENGEIRGSGRSINGVSLYKILKKCSKHLIQFGGHELAAGLTISYDKIKDFEKDFEKYSKEEMLSADTKQIIPIVCEIKKKELNVELLKDIYKMKPFGLANEKPNFIYKHLKVHSISTIKDNKHLKLTLKDENSLIVAFAFSFGYRRDEIKIGDMIDIVGNVNLNTYLDVSTIQIMLKDFRKI